MAILWTGNIAEYLARPFENLYTGGDVAPDPAPFYSIAEAQRKTYRDLLETAALKTMLPDGIHTAGNSSQISDGAAACLVMSRAKADQLGIKPLGVFRSFVTVGVDDAALRFVVAKFYRPGRWSRATIQAEHYFLKALEESEIPVVCPLTDDRGQSIFEINQVMFTIFPKRFSSESDKLGKCSFLSRLVIMTVF